VNWGVLDSVEEGVAYHARGSNVKVQGPIVPGLTNFIHTDLFEIQ